MRIVHITKKFWLSKFCGSYVPLNFEIPDIYYCNICVSAYWKNIVIFTHSSCYVHIVRRNGIFPSDIIFFDQIYFVFHGLKTVFCYSLKLNFICYLNRFFTFHYSLRRGYTVLFLSVRPSKISFVAFFSVTVDGRNLIFGHKRNIGIPYCS
jgi:hypothetical protein